MTKSLPKTNSVWSSKWPGSMRITAWTVFVVMIEIALIRGAVAFPYVSGLMAFREAPAILVSASVVRETRPVARGRPRTGPCPTLTWRAIYTRNPCMS